MVILLSQQPREAFIQFHLIFGSYQLKQILLKNGQDPALRLGNNRTTKLYHFQQTQF